MSNEAPSYGSIVNSFKAFKDNASNFELFQSGGKKGRGSRNGVSVCFMRNFHFILSRAVKNILDMFWQKGT